MQNDRPELVTWRHGRCLPYGEGITFWALGEIVKAEAGILESDDQEAAATKLEDMISGLFAPSAGDVLIDGAPSAGRPDLGISSQSPPGVSPSPCPGSEPVPGHIRDIAQPAPLRSRNNGTG